MALDRYSYPFTAIVGQDEMKLALVLNAINACADLADRMGAHYYGLYDLSRDEIATAVERELGRGR